MQNVKKCNYSDDLNESRYASDKAFDFIPADEKWEISLNTTLDLNFIHDSSLTFEQKEDLLNALAFRVSNFGDEIAKKSIFATKAFISNLSGELTSLTAQSSYKNLSVDYKNQFTHLLKNFVEDNFTLLSEAFNTLYLNYLQDFKSPQFSRKIFDPTKGAHTPTELESLLEGMRILSRDTSQYLDKPRPFFRTKKSKVGYIMGGLALLLMMSILRRPVQLRQIKTCDFRSKKGSFYTEFSNDSILLDYDELKLQTFKAKNKHSQDRSNLDEDLHLLNRKNSKLIIKYCSKMFAEHLKCLNEKGIKLNKEEKLEIFKRFPLFPTYEHISATEIESKEQLFTATHTETTSNHISKSSFTRALSKVIDDTLFPVYQSDRITQQTSRITGNNRIRHTILTIGARDGLDSASLAAITGVSVSTVSAYIDMTPKERGMIDDAFGNNATLLNFGKIRIQDQLHSDDIAFDEYGNKYGAHESATRCAGCKETLPVPISCYGCDNFTALATGDHDRQLKKVINKYEFNKRNGQAERGLRRLKKAIANIEATIDGCELYLANKELSNNDK